MSVDMSPAALRLAQVTDVLRAAEELARSWEPGAARLRASVIRPLGELVDTGPKAGTDGETGSEPADSAASAAGIAQDWADRLWSLTKKVTQLAAWPQAQSQVVEAAAALQDLALRAARSQADGADPDVVVAARLAELGELLGDRPHPAVRVSTNGPYLVTGATSVTDYLGRPVPVQPHMALCRCGASKAKPLCDGTHASIGFSGAKDPKRVPDRRDTYPGTAVTVLDNRGLCQHSGFCTDRLSTVFHAGSEPFVTPSGGRLDDIVNAARNCPSGALSFAVNGVEMREMVDQTDREPLIEVSRDGPYRITGGIPLTEDDGTPVQRPAGASLEHYALCRCGGSQNKPFCSGMHWNVNFSDPPEIEEPTMFEWAGGYPAFLRLARTFYAKYVPEDPLLAPLFAEMSPDHPERVASWLSEVFGGPKYYTKRFGDYNRMLSQHIGKRLTLAQRDRWAGLIAKAADDALLPADADFRAAFVAYVEWGTRLAVENSQQDSHPPLSMPVPRWWWVCDATPWSRVHALEPEVKDDPVVLPADGEPISFAKHIKTLFRHRDRSSMKFVFDLWSYEDVSTHGEAILHRVRTGTMPCDGVWSQEYVDAFQQWIEAGKPE